MLKTTIRFLTVAAALIFAAGTSNVQSDAHASCPLMQSDKTKSANHHDRHSPDSHTEEVNRHGDQAMGFSHAKTTHHFRLNSAGGVIEVTANDPADAASRNQIRTHLKHIAAKFAEGDFTAPMFVHSQTPPGVPVMERLKAEIKYQFEDLERGGQVRITAGNPEALKAIHEFLRFQIEDHKTGDSTEIARQR